MMGRLMKHKSLLYRDGSARTPFVPRGNKAFVPETWNYPSDIEIPLSIVSQLSNFINNFLDLS